MEQIQFNKHSVDPPLQIQLGSCLVPCAALINHSCSPNAHHISEGPELVIRSCRPIAKNEEITISYVDQTRSLEDRQEALLTRYLFICECPRCARGLDEQGEILTGDPTLDKPIRVALSRLHALLDALVKDDKSQELSSVEATMREICHEATPEKPWPINVHPIPTIYGALAKRFEDKREWEKAFFCQLKTVYVIDPLRYPERANPHRVESLMALCQLEKYVPRSALSLGMSSLVLLREQN